MVTPQILILLNTCFIDGVSLVNSRAALWETTRAFHESKGIGSLRWIKRGGPCGPSDGAAINAKPVAASMMALRAGNLFISMRLRLVFPAAVAFPL
jgi:hypothetical protein